MTISRAHSLVGSHPEGRPEDDFYPTDPRAVEQLYAKVLVNRLAPGEHVWECACGDGAISKILETKGYKVISTDKNDHGYGTANVDFLETSLCLAPVIITNPPFILAEQFLAQALDLGAKRVFFLVKLAFLEGMKRSVFLERTPLRGAWIFRQRIRMTRNGEKMKNGGMIAFAWFEWDRGYTGSPQIYWLP